MMLSKVRGEFREFAIHLDLDEEHPEAATVEARVKTASVNTRDVLRDGHLRSPDFFKSDEYPEMVFKSTGSYVPARPRRSYAATSLSATSPSRWSWM